MKRKLIFILLMSIAVNCYSNVENAKQALKEKNYPKAIELFTPIAEGGDSKAAVTMGNIYFTGEKGVKKNYKEAHRWYVKALELGDGDAINNLGVMFRDGKRLKKDRQLAYISFLIVHMNGIGSSQTQERANNNLRREIKEQSEESIRLALCLTSTIWMEAIYGIGKEKGERVVSASDEQRRIKNAKFWSKAEMEKLNYSCPEKL